MFFRAVLLNCDLFLANVTCIGRTLFEKWLSLLYFGMILAHFYTFWIYLHCGLDLIFASSSRLCIYTSFLDYAFTCKMTNIFDILKWDIFLKNDLRKIVFVAQICILFQGTKGLQETKGELERKLSYLFIFCSNYWNFVVNTGLARKKKAGAWSPLAFFYPRWVVSYRWSKK